MANRRLLVTSALPYANGDLHLGHIVEFVLTDIWVRFQRMRGKDVVYVCASDAHGSPIELKALQLNKRPEDVAEGYRKNFIRDLRQFDISLDTFHTTHSPETQKHVYAIFEAARDKGLIYKKEVEGLYSPEDQRFLPDRFIRGTCPRCKSPDQYGDSCEVCGSTYTPADLIDPRSAISGGTLEKRKSAHYFYKLSDTVESLKEWVGAKGSMPNTTRQFVNEWLEGGLHDWDISRDAPYFGFPIPGESDKFFYVWLDAPVGYIGATEKYCAEHGCDAADYWKDPGTDIVHVIGKDIVYFHCLFWPSVLGTADYNRPKRVQVHGFLTVNGEKMSKSRGTFINASTYLRHLDPEYLRYFYASKLRAEPSDLDLNIGTWADPEDPESLDTEGSELVTRVNTEFVNNIANFASRVVQFVNKRFDSRIGPLPPESDDIRRRLVEDYRARIEKAYDAFDCGAAVRIVNELALEANKLFQESEPWKVIATDPERADAICTLGINYVHAIAGLLKPVVPRFAAKVEKALQVDPIAWEDIDFRLENRSIGLFETLVVRVDPQAVKALVIESRLPGEPSASEKKEKKPVTAIKPEITIDEFLKVDLRVALVLSADYVEGADKLLRLTIDVGEENPRNIFAGIRKHYDPKTLEGRRIVVVANLKPRKMRFGISQGMLLAASDGDDVLLLSLDGEPSAGSTVG